MPLAPAAIATGSVASRSDVLSERRSIRSPTSRARALKSVFPDWDSGCMGFSVGAGALPRGKPVGQAKCRNGFVIAVLAAMHLPRPVFSACR